jgi:hypothetical protein
VQAWLQLLQELLCVLVYVLIVVAPFAAFEW